MLEATADARDPAFELLQCKRHCGERPSTGTVNTSTRSVTTGIAVTANRNARGVTAIPLFGGPAGRAYREQDPDTDDNVAEPVLVG